LRRCRLRAAMARYSGRAWFDEAACRKEYAATVIGPQRIHLQLKRRTRPPVPGASCCRYSAQGGARQHPPADRLPKACANRCASWTGPASAPDLGAGVSVVGRQDYTRTLEDRNIAEQLDALVLKDRPRRSLFLVLDQVVARRGRQYCRTNSRRAGTSSCWTDIEVGEVDYGGNRQARGN